MKLTKLIFISFILAISFILVVNKIKPTDNSYNQASLGIIKTAMADGEESPSNTGPKDSQECGAVLCYVTEYYCECRNEYSCTESLCPDH